MCSAFATNQKLVNALAGRGPDTGSPLTACCVASCVADESVLLNTDLVHSRAYCSVRTRINTRALNSGEIKLQIT